MPLAVSEQGGGVSHPSAGSGPVGGVIDCLHSSEFGSLLHSSDALAELSDEGT